MYEQAFFAPPSNVLPWNIDSAYHEPALWRLFVKCVNARDDADQKLTGKHVGNTVAWGLCSRICREEGPMSVSECLLTAVDCVSPDKGYFSHRSDRDLPEREIVLCVD